MRESQPPFDGIRYISESDSPSLMHAIISPSGESACDRMRSNEVSRDKFQPLGGLRSGRASDGQPLRSYFSVSAMALCIKFSVLEVVFQVYQLSESVQS